MKKVILILAVSLISLVNFAQNGLKIKTEIPTNYGMVENLQVRFESFYLDKNLTSSFSVYVQNSDGVIVKTFDVPPLYRYQLNGIPTIQIMWDSVARTLRAKGLIIEDL